MKPATCRLHNSRPKYAPVLAIALVLSASTHQAALAQKTCKQGETKQVSNPMGKVYQGNFKRQSVCKHKDSVYNPPPCWIVEDFKLDIGSFGNSSYSTNFVAANSSFLSEQEWKSEFEAAFKLAASVDSPKLKAELEAAIEQKRKDYAKYRTSILSSHQALQVKMEACGNGTFVDTGSLMEINAKLQLKCVGCEMVDKAILRQSLNATIDDIKRNFKSGPTWTPWLNRDNPGGVGDYETLQDFLKEGKACPKPAKVECQTTDGKDWTTTGQVYTCSADQGGYCKNADQTGGRGCRDYRVRFLCPR